MSNYHTLFTSGRISEDIVDTPRQGATYVPPGGARASYAIDPIARIRLANFAKWGLLAALLLFVLWMPTHYYAANQAVFQECLVKCVNGQYKLIGADNKPVLGADKEPFGTDANGNPIADVTSPVLMTNGHWADQRELPEQTRYNLLVAFATTIFVVIFATGLPRVFLPRVFGRWTEAVDAARDWVVVGFVTACLYVLGTLIFKLLHAHVAFISQMASGFGDWFPTRGPWVIVSALLGLLIARSLALRSEGVVGSGAGRAFGHIVIQALLVGLLFFPFQTGITGLTQSGFATALAIAAVVALLVTVAILGWAWSVDQKLITLQGKNGSFRATNEPVELTLTVIGGRESGKTALLAAAYYEWSLRDLGPLQVRAARDTFGGGPAGMDLEQVATDIYTRYEFPLGTVACRNLPFDLLLDGEKVARFNFLDYPGGALVGSALDAMTVQQFWNRVDETDGVLLIADMSYLRRDLREKDFMEVMSAYKTVMERLVQRNGRNRVVPVALVLTKCDEWVDPRTGEVSQDDIFRALSAYGYEELETLWKNLNKRQGPGFVEWCYWPTSAISYSRPRVDSTGREDLRQPFEIAPPPPPIAPTGCASPLLWISAKVMRWNVTLFCDFMAFLFGSSPKMKRHIEAILELEDVATKRAAEV